MTDLTLVRGDSQNYQIAVVDQDGAAVDLTDAIVKFAIKKRQDDDNSEALVFKASYFADQIEITNAVAGECVVYLYTDDTVNLLTGCYCWDIEIIRRGTVRTIAGSIDVSTGSLVIIGSGLSIADISPGDILVPAGVAVENQVAVTIQEVEGEAGSGNLRTDYDGFVTESAISLQILRANRKTPSGLSGRFNLLAGAVT